uniref:Arsenate reductase n=1 Tax=Candidatus Kentrum sp. MB TaxID=2138164 RepID=A0A450XGE8_9GAMM|nr:MAG: arsenate reductase [Candidatus Kentron sp. MB]VFK74225.1 MAG: arsenate reductase [Candidatus Kentron sp. MB]
MNSHPYHVLFLCTGNSARSILAESILRSQGGQRFASYSAGSHPTGRINPTALALLHSLQIDTTGLRSKSWDEFTEPGAPNIDFVITVCGNAAQETCPVWNGQPIRAHWGVDDPAAVEGTKTEKMAAFRVAFQTLEKRIQAFIRLSIETLNQTNLEKRLREIGKI